MNIGVAKWGGKMEDMVNGGSWINIFISSRESSGVARGSYAHTPVHP